MDGYEPQDAVDALAKLAADELVVMINEAHHVPQHRAFTIALVEALRPLGFTQDGHGAPWSLEPGVRDVTLVHPRSVYVEGRPTWLRPGGARHAWRLPPQVVERALAEHERVLVEARLAAESADAIPVDRIELVAGTTPPALLLPAGRLVVELRGVDDAILARDVEVP